MYRLIIFSLIGIYYCLETNTTDIVYDINSTDITNATEVLVPKTFVAIDGNDTEVREALLFAFGPNKPKEREIDLVDSLKSTDGQTAYKLKVMINYFHECTPNETNIWIFRTDHGCKTISRCETEVIKVNATEPHFKIDSIECVA